ncbi:phosphoribosylpyrophosphate synthetase [Acidiluteibacter ferrifornacis]|nr:phosphoribosylpyrophosphate synthetase [Acidiluteibacter ferrifornacis]
MKKQIGVIEPPSLKTKVMERKDYETVTEALHDLAQNGYTFDFSISDEKDCIICEKHDVQLSDEDFEIDAVYRFEGMNDPGDSMIVYAISSAKFNLKGVVVNGYGVYSNSSAAKIVEKLSKHP